MERERGAYVRFVQGEGGLGFEVLDPAYLSLLVCVWVPLGDKTAFEGVTGGHVHMTGWNEVGTEQLRV